jgi:hypothetical protein
MWVGGPLPCVTRLYMNPLPSPRANPYPPVNEVRLPHLISQAAQLSVGCETSTTCNTQLHRRLLNCSALYTCVNMCHLLVQFATAQTGLCCLLSVLLLRTGTADGLVPAGAALWPPPHIHCSPGVLPSWPSSKSFVSGASFTPAAPAALLPGPPAGPAWPCSKPNSWPSSCC